MQTTLAPEFRGTVEGEEADAILRACVHCGFCTATCPTYQLLGDELDGPRGRIYLIKQVLEGGPVTSKTQLHLDRCLTCRACETTCPSGVRYGRLVDIGRKIVDDRVGRTAGEASVRWSLKKALTPNPITGALAGAVVLVGAGTVMYLVGTKGRDRRFVGQTPQSDDMCLMCVGRKPAV